jgi:hypothetical protein
VEEEWVKVAAAPNETLALVMRGLLDEAGIPALVRRGSGFDVPDFLSAGPRDVLVPHLFAAEARELLGAPRALARGRERTSVVPAGR